MVNLSRTCQKPAKLQLIFVMLLKEIKLIWMSRCFLVRVNYDSDQFISIHSFLAFLKAVLPQLIHPCPYEGTIQARNLKLNQRLIPVRSGVGSYMHETIFYINNSIAATVKLFTKNG